MKRAKDPGIGYRVVATITGVMGPCGAGHEVRDSFEINCHNPGGCAVCFIVTYFPA